MINRLETKLRKGAAAILAFCVASTSCMGNAFAAVREAEEDDEIELVECVIDLDWEKLETSIEDAIRSNRILKDESDFFFVSDDADTVAQYRQLLAASKENRCTRWIISSRKRICRTRRPSSCSCAGTETRRWHTTTEAGKRS